MQDIPARLMCLSIAGKVKVETYLICFFDSLLPASDIKRIVTARPTSWKFSRQTDVGLHSQRYPPKDIHGQLKISEYGTPDAIMKWVEEVNAVEERLRVKEQVGHDTLSSTLATLGATWIDKCS